MRRIGVISDVHGNLASLSAALAAADAQGCAEVWCLGDTFSGADAAECFALVRERCTRVLFGNHEEMVLAVDLDEHSQPPAQDSPIGLACAQLRERPDLRPLLLGLRPVETLSAPGGDIVLAHGSPHRPVWHWVRSAEDVDLAFDAAPSAQLVLVGHTHVASVGVRANGRATSSYHEVGRSRHGLELGGVQALVNPGSLGELLPGVPPSWGVLTLADDGRPLRFDWRFL
jgi:predicted phosphodiesterase